MIEVGIVAAFFWGMVVGSWRTEGRDSFAKVALFWAVAYSSFWLVVYLVENVVGHIQIVWVP